MRVLSFRVLQVALRSQVKFLRIYPLRRHASPAQSRALHHIVHASLFCRRIIEESRVLWPELSVNVFETAKLGLGLIVRMGSEPEV
jgi:hypothetical protein